MMRHMSMHDITLAFTDPVFRRYIADTYCNGQLPIYKEQLKKVKQIELPFTENLYNDRIERITPGLDIQCFDGLEYFTGLERLVCKGYTATLNLSQNTGLVYLDCSYCEFSELDVTHNTRLEFLDCSFNRKLVSVDIRSLEFLRVFICERCSLTEINTTHNVRLEVFNCNVNPLTVPLNFTYNTGLRILKCCYTNQSVLDISHNTGLEYLDCSENHLTAIDTGNQPHLHVLYCSANPLHTLTLKNNPELRDLSIGFTYLKEVDLSYTPRLKQFSSWMGELTSLDLSYNPDLEYLMVMGNKGLTAVDTRHNPALKIFHAGRCALTEVDVTHNPLLEEFLCSGNPLTQKPDISHNPYLLLAGEDNAYLFGYTIIQPPFSVPELGCFHFNERYIYYRLETHLQHIPWQITVHVRFEDEFREFIPTLLTLWCIIQEFMQYVPLTLYQGGAVDITKDGIFKIYLHTGDYWPNGDKKYIEVTPSQNPFRRPPLTIEELEAMRGKPDLLVRYVRRKIYMKR